MKLFKKNESGRSMVEMLGVLAIIGVLSVGGIAGYKYAMRQIAKNSFAEFLNYWGLTVEYIYSTGIIDDIPLGAGADNYLTNKEIFCSSGIFPQKYCDASGHYFSPEHSLFSERFYTYHSSNNGITLGLFLKPYSPKNDAERQEKIENCKEVIKIASSVFPDAYFDSPNNFSDTDAEGALVGCEKAPLYLYINAFWYKAEE